MTLKLSKQEIIKEILKCGKDPLYFINNYCRISHPLKGLIPFNTYPYQDDLVKDFNGRPLTKQNNSYYKMVDCGQVSL